MVLVEITDVRLLKLFMRHRFDFVANSNCFVQLKNMFETKHPLKNIQAESSQK